ncbi:hypothetical protein GE09DRAFT_1283682 [Coniochaeta sp. 2T2.1]|nr:hypothetical protein GE09DRAFT_1283682 [Coniochaeta sp. 2T2.1]
MSASSEVSGGTEKYLKRALEDDKDEGGPSAKKLHRHHNGHTENSEGVAVSERGNEDKSEGNTMTTTNGKPNNSHQNQPEDMVQFCWRNGYITANDRPLNDVDTPGHIPLKFYEVAKRRWYAVFIQISGRVAQEPCTTCARGRGGRWAECVIDETVGHYRACACCLYDHNPNQCSFTDGNNSQLSKDLEATITKLTAIEAESNQTSETLNALTAKLDNSPLPPTAADIQQLERDTVEVGTRAGRLLAEKLILKRRRDYLKTRLSKS